MSLRGRAARSASNVETPLASGMLGRRGAEDERGAEEKEQQFK